MIKNNKQIYQKNNYKIHKLRLKINKKIKKLKLKLNKKIKNNNFSQNCPRFRITNYKFIMKI